MSKILNAFIFLLLSSQAIYAAPPVFVKTAQEAFILSEEIKVDVYLVFTANWCPSCNVMKNDIHNNLEQFQNVIICYVDYDLNKEMVKQYDVKVLPDSRIYRNKVEIKQKTGYSSLLDLVDWFNKESI